MVPHWGNILSTLGYIILVTLNLGYLFQCSTTLGYTTMGNPTESFYPELSSTL